MASDFSRDFFTISLENALQILLTPPHVSYKACEICSKLYDLDSLHQRSEQIDMIGGYFLKILYSGLGVLQSLTR